MLLVIVLLAFIAFFALRGYSKGFIRTLTWLVSLIAAYAVTFWWLAPVAEWLRDNTPLQGMLVYPVAGMLLFVPVSLGVTFLLEWLDRRLASRPRLTLFSKGGGLVLGSISGAFFGLLAIYLISLVQETNNTADEYSAGGVASISRNVMSFLGARLVGLVQPEAVPFTAAFLHSPFATGKRLYNVSQLPELKTLLDDNELVLLVDEGDIDAISQHPQFKQLATNAEVQTLLVQTGLMGDEIPTEANIARMVVNSKLALERFRAHPRVEALMNDPEFRKKVESGNQLALMNDPRFPELLSLFLESARQIPATQNNSSQD